MLIDNIQVLDSIAREASRQAAFFRGRNNTLSLAWANISREALGAMTGGTALLIEGESGELPIPIKGCEQGPKVYNPHE